jgi:CheY-like chemotaxis protein
MTPRPLRILQLCRNERKASFDRRTLRECCTDIQVTTKGVDTARMLAAPGAILPDVIVCDQQLEDIDGNRFCAILNLHPALCRIPVLLLLPNETALIDLKAHGTDAAALLTRPFTVQALRDHVLALAAMQPPEESPGGTDTGRFSAALATCGALLRHPETSGDFARVGMECLEQEQWTGAIHAFGRALDMGGPDGDVLLGLSHAWRRRGSEEKFLAFLAQAGDAFVLRQSWEKARSATKLLLDNDPAARNPFLSRAQRLLKRGNTIQAAQVILQCLEVTPGKDICERIAQTCSAMGHPEQALEILRKALESRLGDFGRQLVAAIAARLKDIVRENEIHRWKSSLERLANPAQPEPALRRKGTGLAPEPPPDENGSALLVPPWEGTPRPYTTPADFAASEGAPPSSTGIQGLGDLMAVFRCTWKLMAGKDPGTTTG